MKKFVLLFALLLSVSASFVSCRETPEEEAEEQIEETTDDIEEAADDLEDEY